MNTSPANSENKRITVKAMCLVEHNGKLLVCKGYDKVKDETLFRVLGGSLNFGEKAETAVRREIKEELNSEIENLCFLKIIESIFAYEGKKGHEIIFLYKGDLLDKKIYQQKLIPILDSQGFPAEWILISDILEGKVRLYPVFDYKEIFSTYFNVK